MSKWLCSRFVPPPTTSLLRSPLRREWRIRSNNSVCSFRKADTSIRSRSALMRWEGIKTNCFLHIQVRIDTAKYLCALNYVSDHVDHRVNLRVIAWKTDVFQNDILPKQSQNETKHIATTISNDLFYSMLEWVCCFFCVCCSFIDICTRVMNYYWGDFDYLFSWLCIFCITHCVNNPPL